MVAWFVACATVAVVIAALRRRGRPWYRSAYSQRSVDGWTFTHIGHGLVLFGLAKMLLPWPDYELVAAVVIVEALWESFENRNWVINFFRAGGDKDYYGDSIVNSICDILACTAGAVFLSFWI